MLKVAGVELISGREIVSVGTLLPDEVVCGKVNSSNLSLMQYTGLKDKNGREIYESDILRVERDDDPNDFYIAPVSWCGGDYPAFDILPKYWPHRVNYDTNALSAIYAGWSEEVMTVIGNIYEDPDLLEAEK